MNDKKQLGFAKINYIIMIIGVVMLFVGFYIMTLDKEAYGFGFLGLTLGPIIVMLGFAVEFVAILYKSKSDQ